MQNNLIEENKVIYPLKNFYIDSKFFGLNIDTIIYTWVAMVLLLFVLLLIRYFLSKNSNSIARFFIISLAKNLTSLVKESLDNFVYKYYIFVGSLFIFIIFCNWISIIPFVEEPTKDLNTTLALAIISFFYNQREKIYAHGLLSYLKEYFSPISIIFPINIIIGIVLLPLKLLGELATVISLSFRLFGNIFGGFIISSIYRKAISGSIIYNFLAIFTGINLLVTTFFVIFEGFLQAFVFSILTLTSITMSVSKEE